MKPSPEVKKILIAAHRGGKCEFQENTLEAFKYAIEHGANAIEMDLRFDHWNKRFYLEHDFFHSVKDKQNLVDKVVPFLPDETTLFIELKSLAWLRNYFVRQFLITFEKFFSGKDSVVISYNPFVLRQLKKLRPEIRVGYICGNFFWGWVFRTFIVKMIKPDVLFLHRRMLKSMFDFARNENMTVVAFGMDKPEEWKRASQMDLAGVVTDFPEAAKKIISNNEL